MHTPAAQQNTNEILSLILDALQSGEVLDEMSKYRFLREADNQVMLERGLTLKALTHTAAHERELAKKFALEGLKYISDPATLSNCLKVLQINGYSKTLLEHVNLCLNYFDQADYITCFGSVIVSFPNVLHASLIIKNLEKMELVEQHRDLYMCCTHITNTAEEAAKRFSLDKGVYSALSNVVANIAERNAVVINEAEMTIPPESDWVSLVYFVESEDIDKLVDMNFQLVDDVIDAELDTKPVVVRFEPLTPSSTTIVGNYAR
ncbi:hypothetical protein C1S86_11305 [Vibrio parahaemolyticus]|uniref:hypothetical protein n=1 Tax=Vibrio parahaemolyticus TaxID=670 RepID=UPI000993F94B|nr:hypothetical protein [Vibrio parahaemolyticus]OOQ70148.1 hypothetical protein BSR61_10175 [Vibrio parahaemolyticus]PMT76145.1 hypothetical protein C1S97_14250 [Vibrio parahaemolyticus]PMT81681.1 hypothetical protein C1S86_11305 [Vibrio parahaemolyticus]